MSVTTFDEWWDEAIDPNLFMATEVLSDLGSALYGREITLSSVKEKARRGWHEHGGSILHWYADDAIDAAKDEIRDLLVYTAYAIHSYKKENARA